MAALNAVATQDARNHGQGCLKTDLPSQWCASEQYEGQQYAQSGAVDATGLENQLTPQC